MYQQVHRLHPGQEVMYASPAPQSYVRAAPVHVVQGPSTVQPALAPTWTPAAPANFVHSHGYAVGGTAFAPVVRSVSPAAVHRRSLSPHRIQVARAAEVFPTGAQACHLLEQFPKEYAETSSQQQRLQDTQYQQQLIHHGQFQPQGGVGYEETSGDPQEQFQLGDEASNVQGCWQEQNRADSNSDNQFLALLESLEARVDLMSQMQQTRAAIQQRAQESLIAPDDTGLRAMHDSQTFAETDGTFQENAHLRARVQDQEGHIAMLTQEVENMRRHLSSIDDTTSKARLDRMAAVVDASSTGQSDLGPIDTTQRVPYLEVPAEFDADRIPVVLPFCPAACGANLEISEDGYMATRTRGCRQSVAIGTGPLDMQLHGRYFEIVVKDTVTGWVGGLGIGVTSTCPVGLRRVPDKAWRVPGTMVIGYWGCIFLDGIEHRTDWRSDNLAPGARVGLLITKDEGDLLVFVDGELVVKVEGAIPCDGNPEPLYPIVDVFAATRVISLVPNSSPPAPPWASVSSPISAAAVRREGHVGLPTADLSLTGTFQH
eukprot:TRINITY_DN47115_c0_g1_i1.p1 TRINITY_DN47115_c0_g1~~TRINITY_DN47115_c0_g1_i1.p1  ORF type:complete len:543 (+),score=81.65 TRINITY_DN47115_c0_g1_i1:48-1676(+)